MSFANIKEQPRVISSIKSALKKNTLPHGLLFLGPSDCGQKEVAAAVAQYLFCEKPKDTDSCGECIQCRSMEKESHPDFSVLESSLDSGLIRVEDIRTLVASANLRPFQAKSKVFVVNPADALNDAAQNALLKTLEEPPPGTYFILWSSAPERLLPTIRSRVQTFHFSPMVGKKVLEEEQTQSLMGFLEYFSGTNSVPPDLSGLDREELIVILDLAIETVHQALRIKAGLLEAPEAGPQTFWVQNAANRFDSEVLMDCVETLADFKEKIVGNVNMKLALAVLWDSLRKVAA